jgi:hypothetical protein
MHERFPPDSDLQRYTAYLISVGYQQRNNIHAYRSNEKYFCIETRPDGDTEVYTVPCISAIFTPEGQHKTFC